MRGKHQDQQDLMKGWVYLGKEKSHDCRVMEMQRHLSQLTPLTSFSVANWSLSALQHTILPPKREPVATISSTGIHPTQSARPTHLSYLRRTLSPSGNPSLHSSPSFDRSSHTILYFLTGSFTVCNSISLRVLSSSDRMQDPGEQRYCLCHSTLCHQYVSKASGIW